LFQDPNEASEVAYFSIEDIGAEVVAGKNLTVRVGAKDADGDVVTDYTGTIRFSSSDDRAVLPHDYTFSTEDQGWHTFYLSVMLQTEGMQTVAVHDLDDFRISGERNVTVSDGSGVVAIPDEDASLSIDVPMNGASFSSSRVTISGTAVGTSLITLKDGPITLIDELPVDASGKYVYQTPGLADGMHVFQATSVEDPTIVSNAVQITIDRSPPQVMSTEISPAGKIAPGSQFTVTIGASDELSSVSVVFGGKTYELSADDGSGSGAGGTGGMNGSGVGAGSGNGAGGVSKVFSGTMRAPLANGEYPMEVTLSDLLGNKMTEPNAGVVSVGDPTEGFDVQLIPSGKVAALSPVEMKVIAQEKVSAVSAELQGKKYELTSSDFKNFSKETVAPAEKGTYPVKFTAVDLRGKVIDLGEKSLIVGDDYVIDLLPSGTVAPQTKSTMKVTSKNPISNVVGTLLGQPYPLTSNDSLNFTGEVVAPAEFGEYFVVFSATDGQGSPIQLGQKPLIVGDAQNVAPLPVSNLQTTPGEEKVTLFWSPSVDDSGIRQYRIKFGPSPDNLIGENITPDPRTQWYVDSLAPCKEMFFTVTPIDEQGVEGETSAVVAGTPLCDEEVTHPAPPKTGTGSSMWIVVFSVLSGIGVMLLFRRRA
jgi:hypothetical protein